MSPTLARKLGKQPTPAEQKLWNWLRSRQLAGYKFRRQFPIGKYVVDFACFRLRLIVEADGGQHAESEGDAVRTREIENQGWHLIRFWNKEIMENGKGVWMAILSELENKQPLTRLALCARHPLPVGEGKMPNRIVAF